MTTKKPEAHVFKKMALAIASLKRAHNLCWEVSQMMLPYDREEAIKEARICVAEAAKDLEGL